MSKAGMESISGIRQASAPLPRYPSASTTTGVMNSVAIRNASSAMSKQSAGLAGASTHRGASPLRPQSAWFRSACSVLVGIPVLGPARWTLITTRGSSVITARPRASPFSAIPGPLVPVTAKAPAKAAPIADVMAAISSSAWKVRTS